MNNARNAAQSHPALLPLTPGLLQEDELAAYDRQFSLVFDDPALTNIAVSGAPGSGKSTVMNSWAAANPQHNWLEVSLSNFVREDEAPSANTVEEALINQIVGKMDLRRAPKTRFRKSMERPWTTDLAYALTAAAFIALSIFLGWVLTLIPSSRPATWLVALAAAAWFACIVFAVYRIGRTDALGRLARRLNIDTREIELSDSEEGSPLQRYMGDLVYLLNTSVYDSVIFDDIDTFGNLTVFQHLRQLEDLANARRDGSRPRLRFFYLVSDSMFENPHDRAKFFDYIISVIPYIDPSNSLALFREGLEGVGIEADEEFLYEVSLFIDDPRILRDLVNETCHYKAVLFGDAPMQEGDMERLIAILAYKTLFPRDFELLQVDQGYVNALLRSRPLIVEDLTAQNTREAEALERQLQTGMNVRDEEALRQRLDEMEGENLRYSRQTLAQLLGTLEDSDAIFAAPPYDHGLDRPYLSEVLASPHFPLIKFLVKRGWIDDTHERFMSNFYSDSISVRDREFLMGVFQGKPLNPSYRIENPGAVLGRLDADTLSWSNAKNYWLLSYLLRHGPEEKLKALFAGIRHDRSLEWLLDYTESKAFDSAVFAEMELRLQNPIASLLADESIEQVRRRRFAHRILASGSPVLDEQKVRDALHGFAMDDLAFLQVEVTKPINIAEGLVAIGYRPSDIYTDGVSKKLLRFVFRQGLFEPTAPFLDSLTAAVLDASPALESGYLVTRLYNIDDPEIRAVVEQNADRFVETLLENTERNLTESSEAIAWLLNAETLSDRWARAYIDAIGDSTAIDDVNAVKNPAYQAALLDRGHVAITAENILDYFKASDFVIDAHLGELLENNPFPEELTMGFAEDHLGDESGFLTSAIQSPYISDGKMAEIARIYRAQFNHFGLEGLTDERMSMLIDCGVVRPTVDNLRFVRQSNPAAAKEFAQADTKAYLELVVPDEEGEAPCPAQLDEVLEVFSMDEVDDRSKLILLDVLEGPVQLQESYPNALNAAIAARHFDPDEDLEKVSTLYMNGDRRLKRALAEAFVEQSLNATDQPVRLSMDMVADIAWRMRNERQDMLAFIADQLRDRDPEPTRFEVRSIFERANLREYLELMDGPSAVIPQSPADDKLLEALVELNMAGKQSGKADWQGQRRINSKGYSRK